MAKPSEPFALLVTWFAPRCFKLLFLPSFRLRLFFHPLIPLTSYPPPLSSSKLPLKFCSGYLLLILTSLFGLSPSYYHLLDHVCFLCKALYGLKQALHAWYQRFVVYLFTLGFYSSKPDSSLFTYHRSFDIVYLLLYIGDIILTTSSTTLISKVISQLSSEFPMSDLGSLSFFIGIASTRTLYGLFLS